MQITPETGSIFGAIQQHGARSTIVHAKHRDDRLSVWVTDLVKRSHTNVAAVALANKTVRMAWAMMKNDTDYDPARAAA